VALLPSFSRGKATAASCRAMLAYYIRRLPQSVVQAADPGEGCPTAEPLVQDTISHRELSAS
jgi:hypothetical protein